MSFSKFEAFIFDQLAETYLPGLSAAIVRDGEVIWARGFGFRDLEQGLPATPETAYAIASMTKSFTCLAILQLAEAGKLRPDDPLEDHIPAFQIRPGGEPVRLWHLMSHTSGLPALAYAEQMLTAASGGGGVPLPIASADDVLAFMRDAGDWALNKPGERWYYLNEGYALLGAVIEQRSGMPFRDYITQHILRPLGMARSFFDRARYDADPDAAVPYTIDREHNRLPKTYTFGRVTADGGLISNAPDMARYLMMFLNNGVSDSGERLISPDSLREMMTPRTTTPERGSPFGNSGYGYGLMVTPDFYGHRVIGHGGSVGIATSNMAFIPDLNVGIVVLGNGTGYPMSQFALYGLAELLGHDPDALPFVQLEKWQKKLSGVYETYRGTMQARVSPAGGFMMLEISDRHNTTTVPLVPYELEAVQPTAFYTLANGLQYPTDFRVSGEGAAERIEMVYGRYLFRRVGKLT